MRKTMNVVLSLAVALTATTVFAGSTHKASSKATMEARGTVEAYDAEAHRLTLKTKTGDEVFTVATDTKVYEGSGKGAKVVALTTLGTETGDHAVVKFSEEHGEKTAMSVRLSEPAAKKSEASKKTTSTSSKKY
jgi:hypothetical protein